jgi:hypothetical protein
MGYSTLGLFIITIIALHYFGIDDVYIIHASLLSCTAFMSYSTYWMKKDSRELWRTPTEIERLRRLVDTTRR